MRNVQRKDTARDCAPSEFALVRFKDSIINRQGELP